MIEKSVESEKILYMLQINPCHMSDFGVLLIEVIICEEENHV